MEAKRESWILHMPWDIETIQFTDEVLPDEPRGFLMDEEMAWLMDHVAWNGEGAMERIFRATILLHAKFHETHTLGQCLHQALIWECG